MELHESKHRWIKCHEKIDGKKKLWLYSCISECWCNLSSQEQYLNKKEARGKKDGQNFRELGYTKVYLKLYSEAKFGDLAEFHSVSYSIQEWRLMKALKKFCFCTILRGLLF